MRIHRQRGRDYDLPLPPQEITRHELNEWFDRLGKQAGTPPDPRWWLETEGKNQ